MRLPLVLVIGGCAACGKIEELEDPPPASFVVQPDGAGLTVSTALYSMHFADGGALTAMHFPDELRIDGSPNVLGPEEGCAGEQLVGLAMFPAFVTAPAISRPPENARFMFDTEINSGTGVNNPGPHVVQIGLSYAIDYSCDTLQRFEGRSTFTFYPSGRIVRNDFDLRPASEPLTSAGQACGCGTATNNGPLAFTTFWTFNGEGGRTVQRDGSPITFEPPPSSDQNGPFDGLCTIYDNHAIGVSHAGMTSRVRNNVNTQAGRSNFAHVFDWNLDPMLEHVVTEGATPAEDVLFASSSAIQISLEDALVDSRCGEVLEGLSEPAILVGEMQLDEADADGVYVDFATHVEDFEIRAPVDPLPPGWAFRTAIPSGVVRIKRDPPLDTERPVALIQKEGGVDEYLFYFPEGLEPSEVITFEVL